MVMILDKQVLHARGGTEVYQTYDTETELFGMCRVDGNGTEFLPAIFRYTFSFDHCGTCVVVTQSDEFKRVNLKWETIAMAAADEREHRLYILKYSLCVCAGKGELNGGCTACGGIGKIRTRYVCQHNRRIFNF
ncbi:hypothetical protein EFA69_14615 [Rufibacter immobilis]|uniref:Uncharacterized protein n=1 Tax=Rufibacter immobilis TaxID=1348778 RepID=A0A3M9MPC7_9BACT|nr:hypothetical protein [Rufibacter immobilis]RNI27369.1 hypothetical protein EFA69_14615 [Rufibacter immobilis]